MVDPTPINKKPTAASIRAEAEAEVSQDITNSAKARMKGKLRELANAKKVVQNLEGELAVLQRDVEAELGA